MLLGLPAQVAARRLLGLRPRLLVDERAQLGELSLANRERLLEICGTGLELPVLRDRLAEARLALASRLKLDPELVDLGALTVGGRFGGRLLQGRL